MKTLRNLGVLFIALFVMSCSSDELENSKTQNDLLIESLKNSDDFKFYQNAGVNFDFSNAKKRTESDINSLLMGVSGNNSNRNLLGLNENSQVVSIYDNEELIQLVLVKNLTSNDDIFENIEDFSGQIATGALNSADEYEEIYLTFDHGVITDVNMDHLIEKYSNQRMPDVRSWAYCIGDKFEQGGNDCINNGDGCAEEATCYIGFGICMIARAIDCAI